MHYIERDLEIARYNVVTLERFIGKHRAILASATWDAELKPRAEQLLSQFEAALREAHSRYNEIWSDLYSAERPAPDESHLQNHVPEREDLYRQGFERHNHVRWECG